MKMNNMFDNNEFFNDVNKNNNSVNIEIKPPKGISNVLFGIISTVTSAVSFCMMFCGYFVLNFAAEITERPFHNIKLMMYTAIFIFSLTAIIFGIIGIVKYSKKEKSSSSDTVSIVMSIIGLILGTITTIMSFVFFFI